MTDWQSIWAAKALEKSDFAASGRSSSTPAQLFALLSDACSALQPAITDRLLDVGCGIGLLARHLAPYVSDVVGLDLAVPSLRRAASSLPSAAFVAGTIVELPFAAGSFSKVLASSVMQYLDDDAAVLSALREMRRVTAPGGRAFASANPDRRKKEEYIGGIDRLNLPEERKAVLRASNRAAFWLSRETIVEQASEAGWTATVRPISDVIWQSFYMFDLVLDAR